MEKIKSLLQDEKFQKKLAKLSAKKRAEVEQTVRDGEKLKKKWQRKEEALMRMPKEKRLKAICKEYLLVALDTGKLIGAGLREKSYKEHAMWLEASSKKRLGYELTTRLKAANILPLEG